MMQSIFFDFLMITLGTNVDFLTIEPMQLEDLDFENIEKILLLDNFLWLINNTPRNHFLMIIVLYITNLPV